MKRMFAFALVIVTMLAFSTNQIDSTRANTVSPTHLTKIGELTMNGELNLDFTIVNKTGYGITALYVGPSANKEWTADMEVLHGRTFKNGAALDITFNPKARATKWDIMVEWEDGDDNSEWLGLKLTEISKVTLTYNRKTDEARAIIE